MPVVTQSPAEPFADALLTALLADDALTTIVGTKILATLPQQSRTAFPYILGSRRTVWPGAVGMQREGGRVQVYLDFWSGENSTDQVSQMMSRARVVLQRTDLAVNGFHLMGGSLVCEEEQVILDADPDMPQRSVMHGVQLWTAELEELS